MLSHILCYLMYTAGRVRGRVAAKVLCREREREDRREERRERERERERVRGRVAAKILCFGLRSWERELPEGVRCVEGHAVWARARAG